MTPVEYGLGIASSIITILVVGWKLGRSVGILSWQVNHITKEITKLQGKIERVEQWVYSKQ